MVTFPQRCLAELALYVSITNLAATSPTNGALAVYDSNIYSPVKALVSTCGYTGEPLKVNVTRR